LTSLAKSILLIGNFLSRETGVQSPGEALAEKLAESGRRVFTVSHKSGRLPRLADILTAVWRWRKAYSLAYVEVFSGPAFVWAEAACWALRRVNKPYVCALHGGDLPEFSRSWPNRVRKLLTSAAAVTTPSAYLQTALRNLHRDLRLIPNPLEVKAYPFRLRSHPLPRLVWLRAFHNIYNPFLAPQALALLAQEFPDLELTMVGPDKGDGSLAIVRNQALRLGVAHRIAFSGRVTKAEVPVWLNRGDIFLNTTNVDNTPVSVLEAMAAGLCVVSTNVGGVPYLLHHEIDALLTSPDNPRSMATAIRRLLTEPGLAERISGNARRKVKQFDWSIVLPRWEALLLELSQSNQQ
jgi:glycosyltransferase involved in cell wall biosynthesis